MFLCQVYAWGDNDHGQQGNGTTTVNRKPTLVQGLEGQKITRVACGSSHSVAWTTVDVTTPSVHEPVLFQTARDSLGASYLGNPHFPAAYLHSPPFQSFMMVGIVMVVFFVDATASKFLTNSHIQYTVQYV